MQGNKTTKAYGVKWWGRVRNINNELEEKGLQRRTVDND